MRQECLSPIEAAEAACESGDAVAMALTADGRGLSILTATPFGTNVRRWHDTDPAMISEIVADTVRAQSKTFLCVTDPDPLTVADNGTFDAFLERKPDLPVTFDPNGRPRAGWWSVAPYHIKPFGLGDELAPRPIRVAGGCSIVYFHADGRSGGTHIVTNRVFDPDELELIRDSRAIVRSVASGWGHDDAGRPIDIQILMLDIPYDFALAFSEGVLPLRPTTKPMEAAIA